MILIFLILSVLIYVNERYFSKDKNMIIYIIISMLSTSVFFLGQVELPGFIANGQFDKIVGVLYLFLSAVGILYLTVENAKKTYTIDKKLLGFLGLVYFNNLYLLSFLIFMLLNNSDVKYTERGLSITKRYVAVMFIIILALTNYSGPTWIYTLFVIGIICDFILRKKDALNTLLPVLVIFFITRTTHDQLIEMYALMSLCLGVAIVLTVEPDWLKVIEKLAFKSKYVEKTWLQVTLSYKHQLNFNYNKNITTQVKFQKVTAVDQFFGSDKNSTYILLLLITLAAILFGGR